MTVFDALQTQYNKERSNAAQYHASAASLEAANWPGFAKYFDDAAADEQSHSKLFRDYLIDRNQVPMLTALPAPMMIDGNTPLAHFQAALSLEKENTATITALEELAESLDDDQTETFLIPLINEQTKSERELVDAILEIGRVGADGLLILDREYGR
jgi:ferritin